MANQEKRLTNEKPAWSRLFAGDKNAFEQWHSKLCRAHKAKTKSPEPECFSLSPDLVDASDYATLARMIQSVRESGAALYEWTTTSVNAVDGVNALLRALDLHASDRGVIRHTSELSLLEDLSGTPKGRFPPYRSSAMNWHTDGYYNAADNPVRCFTLHCVAPAALGGSLSLMDDEQLVYALWQDNPELIRLLSQPDAMTLPQNQDTDGHDRPDRTLPVIFRHTDGAVAMRFTTRSKHIHWRCDDTQAAAERAAAMIDEQCSRHVRVKLKAGQGIVTRNILHSREAFSDGSGQPKRQMLRGRFALLPDINRVKTTTMPNLEETQHAPRQ